MQTPESKQLCVSLNKMKRSRIPIQLLVVAIKLSMLTKGRNSVRASNNANTNWTLGRWIPETTDLMKFTSLHLYHEVQSTFSILGDKIFPGKRFISH